MLKSYWRILRTPVTLTVVAGLAGTWQFSKMASAQDPVVLGLLSQFDGTAATVLVAVSAIKQDRGTEEYAAVGADHRRKVRLHFGLVMTMLAFSASTLGSHNHGLGGLAMALNLLTILALLWAVFAGA